MHPQCALAQQTHTNECARAPSTEGKVKIAAHVVRRTSFAATSVSAAAAAVAAAAAADVSRAIASNQTITAIALKVHGFMRTITPKGSHRLRWPRGSS